MPEGRNTVGSNEGRAKPRAEGGASRRERNPVARPEEPHDPVAIAENAPVRRLHLLLAAALALAGTACGQNRDALPPPPLSAELYEIDAADVPAEGKYLRYVPAGPRGGGLDIAVTDFAPAGEGPTISVFGVVPVADDLYYQKVQRELDGYETVLYEGVKPSDLSAAGWQKRMLDRSGEAGELQKELAEWFGFRYQLEAIDYTRANLVHADMSLEEFAREGGERLGLVPRTKEGGDESDLPTEVRSTWSEVLKFGRMALGTPGPLQSLARKMFAETMGTSDIGTSLDLVPGLSELILHKRNAVVMDVLKANLPKAKRSIAVFYGAAHMADLGLRLEKDLAYHRTGGRWLRAWALRPPLR